VAVKILPVDQERHRDQSGYVKRGARRGKNDRAPNIVDVLGLASPTMDGHYLVMELFEGEDHFVRRRAHAPHDMCFLSEVCEVVDRGSRRLEPRTKPASAPGFKALRTSASRTHHIKCSTGIGSCDVGEGGPRHPERRHATGDLDRHAEISVLQKKVRGQSSMARPMSLLARRT